MTYLTALEFDEKVISELILAKPGKYTKGILTRQKIKENHSRTPYIGHMVSQVESRLEINMRYKATF